MRANDRLSFTLGREPKSATLELPNYAHGLLASNGETGIQPLGQQLHDECSNCACHFRSWAGDAHTRTLDRDRYALEAVSESGKLTTSII